MNDTTKPELKPSTEAQIEAAAKAHWEAGRYSKNCSWDFQQAPTHLTEDVKEECRIQMKAALIAASEVES